MPSTDESFDTEGYFSINGSKMYYKALRVGDPVIVVHGGPVLDHTYLLPWFEELTKTHRVILYDQRACGKSSYEIDSAKMTLNHLAEDIGLLADSLGLKKFHLIGHSWGGLLAMKYASLHQERLTSLILIGALPPNTAMWQEEQQIETQNLTKKDSLDRVKVLQSGILQQDYEAGVKQLLTLSFRSQFHDTTLLKNLTIEVAKEYKKRSTAFSLLMPDLMQFNLDSAISGLTIPVLLIYGEGETGASYSGNHLDSIIPQSQKVTITQAGHFPFVERPQPFFNEIERFYNNIQP